MHFWAERNQDEWTVNRVELSINSQPDKRLLIK